METDVPWRMATVLVVQDLPGSGIDSPPFWRRQVFLAVSMKLNHQSRCDSQLYRNILNSGYQRPNNWTPLNFLLLGPDDQTLRTDYGTWSNSVLLTVYAEYKSADVGIGGPDEMEIAPAH